MTRSMVRAISIRRLKQTFLAGISLLLVTGTTWAQGYFGAIVGTVTDASNATAPGVAITISNLQTGVNYSVTTNQYGYYTVGQLIPGSYSVTAKSPGFETLVVQPVKVDVDRTITVDMSLKIGAVTQTVQVMASAPLLDTTSGTVGTNIATSTVLDMPLNGRNFTQLLELTPGTVGTGNLFMAAGGSNYSVSGLSDAQNNFTLDGVYDNEEFFAQFAAQPVIDSIQEFKVQTNITSAEFGRAAGANVAVATKSGTNQLHGSAWEFFRNDALDANQWFNNFYGIRLGVYHRNQYGFTAGGPIYLPRLYNGKDKAFWFADYEGTRFTQAANQVATIPTQAMLSGDFSAPGLPVVYNPQTTTQVGTTASGVPIYSRQPFPNNIIPSDMISPITKDYAGIFYPSTTTAGANNFARALPNTLSQYQINGRVDYNFSSNVRLFGRVTDQHVYQDSPSSLPAESTNFFNTFTNAGAGLTWLLGPTTVLDVKSAFNRTNLDQCNTNPAPGVAQFLSKNPIQGFAIVDSSCPLYPQFGITGYSSPSQGGAFFLTNMWQEMASLSMTRGRHSMKAGFELDHMNAATNNVGIGGNFVFDNVPTGGFTAAGGIDPNTGNPVASFLLGLATSGLRNVGQLEAYMHQTQPSFYFQDDFHVNRKLTVNLGLRYEYDQWPYEKYGRLGNYYFDSHMYGWAGVNPITGAPPNAPRSLMNPEYDSFAPRIGLAYSLTPKTVIRAGAGVFWEGDYYWVGQGPRGQWPYAVSEDFAGTNSTLPDRPLATFMPSYLTPTATSPPNEQHVVPRNNRLPYTFQWNLGVQRELVRDLLLEVTYVGNASRRLASILNGNTALPGPGTVGSPEHPRMEQQYTPSLGAVTLMLNRGTSNYNGLQVKLDKRFSNGLQATVSYAHSHALEVAGSGNFSHFTAPQNPACIYCDYGDSSFDYPHIFTASGIYQLPFGRGLRYASHMNRVLNVFAGNWELTGIYHYQSGFPYTVNIAFDNANTGPRSLEDRPNYLGGSQTATPPAGNGTVGFLNPSAFQIAPQFTFGNLGYNTVRGPSFHNLDSGLYKNFPFNENKQSLQFRAEFFNLPNSHAFGCIDGTVRTPGFGQASCTQGAQRIMQLALKFYW